MFSLECDGVGIARMLRQGLVSSLSPLRAEQLECWSPSLAQACACRDALAQLDSFFGVEHAGASSIQFRLSHYHGALRLNDARLCHFRSTPPAAPY